MERVLAAKNYVIDSRGRTSIEDKVSVRSALRRSPDLADPLMLALGEPTEGRDHPWLLPLSVRSLLMKRLRLSHACAATSGRQPFC